MFDSSMKSITRSHRFELCIVLYNFVYCLFDHREIDDNKSLKVIIANISSRRKNIDNLIIFCFSLVLSLGSAAWQILERNTDKQSIMHEICSILLCFVCGDVQCKWAHWMYAQHQAIYQLNLHKFSCIFFFKLIFFLSFITSTNSIPGKKTWYGTSKKWNFEFYFDTEKC